jgi:hypothetical protein
MDEENLDGYLEKLWDGLLSRQPELVRRTFEQLGAGEQQLVLAHLRRMATESGWHPVQKTSAEAALQALETSD